MFLGTLAKFLGTLAKFLGTSSLAKFLGNFIYEFIH